jgi:hypothetical protein
MSEQDLSTVKEMLGKPDFETALQHFMEHVRSLLKDANVTMYEGVRLDRGRRYMKIVMIGRNGVGGSIWGFVDSNGDVLKAEGYNKPAKHARGTIYDRNTWGGFEWTGPQYLR